MRLNQSERKDYIVDSNIRDAVSLGRASSAPLLCAQYVNTKRQLLENLPDSSPSKSSKKLLTDFRI